MACTMYVWDLILTFGMEVDLVWKSKGSFMRWLYLFQRYWPFTDIMLFSINCQYDVFPIFLFLLFYSSNGGYFEGDRVSEGGLYSWRFVILDSP